MVETKEVMVAARAASPLVLHQPDTDLVKEVTVVPPLVAQPEVTEVLLPVVTLVVMEEMPVAQLAVMAVMLAAQPVVTEAQLAAHLLLMVLQLEALVATEAMPAVMLDTVASRLAVTVDPQEVVHPVADLLVAHEERVP